MLFSSGGKEKKGMKRFFFFFFSFIHGLGVRVLAMLSLSEINEEKRQGYVRIEIGRKRYPGITGTVVYSSLAEAG